MFPQDSRPTSMPSHLDAVAIGRGVGCSEEIGVHSEADVTVVHGCEGFENCDDQSGGQGGFRWVALEPLGMELQVAATPWLWGEL